MEVDIIKKDTASLLTYIDTCDFSKVTEDKSNISRHLSSVISSIAILQQRLEASSRTATAISDTGLQMADNPESFEASEQDNQESFGVVRFQLATNTQLAKTAVHINDDNVRAPSSLASTAKSFDDYVEISEEDEAARGLSGSSAAASAE